jgi:hypothetical protein
LQALQQNFHWIDPPVLSKDIESRGFRVVRSMRRALPSGKAFWMGLFEKLL